MNVKITLHMQNIPLIRFQRQTILTIFELHHRKNKLYLNSLGINSTRPTCKNLLPWQLDRYHNYLRELGARGRGGIKYN